MSVDWLTVSAQIVNFLVLLWLLKRFLYRPILDGIDAREAEIAERMSQAARLMDEARAEAARYREELENLQARQAELAREAQQKAQEERDALIAEAHRGLEQERRDFDAHLANERRKYIEGLTRAGATVLIQLAAKALKDLADETLEQRIALHAVRRLAPLAADLRKMAQEHVPAQVTTHDPLPDQVRARITDELQVLLPGIDCRFETDPAQSFGLVLRIGSANVAWRIDSYLEDLETMLTRNLARVESLQVQPA